MPGTYVSYTETFLPLKNSGNDDIFNNLRNKLIWSYINR